MGPEMRIKERRKAYLLLDQSKNEGLNKREVIVTKNNQISIAGIEEQTTFGNNFNNSPFIKPIAAE